MKNMLAMLFIFVSSSAYAESFNDPLPKTLFKCAKSVITDIGPRLEGDKDFSTGASVTLKNDVISVAYQEDPSLPAIRGSKVGDRVLACLVEIPKDCPPGDDRGRMYTITNLRTLESWTLPDSQHSCGGA